VAPKLIWRRGGDKLHRRQDARSPAPRRQHRHRFGGPCQCSTAPCAIHDHAQRRPAGTGV